MIFRSECSECGRHVAAVEALACGGCGRVVCYLHLDASKLEEPEHPRVWEAVLRAFGLPADATRLPVSRGYRCPDCADSAPPPARVDRVAASR